MSILFKAIEKGQPGVVGGGEKKFYAQIVYRGEIDMDGLVKRIEKFSALSEADIEGVATALENVITEELTEGRVVKLRKLGTFYPAIKSTPSDLATKVKSTNIEKVGVRYRPGRRMMEMLKIAGFEKLGEEPAP